MEEVIGLELWFVELKSAVFVRLTSCVYSAHSRPPCAHS